MKSINEFVFRGPAPVSPTDVFAPFIESSVVVYRFSLIEDAIHGMTTATLKACMRNINNIHTIDHKTRG